MQTEYLSNMQVDYGFRDPEDVAAEAIELAELNEEFALAELGPELQ